MKNIALIIIAAVAVAGAYFVKVNYVPQQSFEGAANVNVITNEGITQTATSTSAEAITVLEENYGRTYALIVNDSDTVMYLNFGAKANAALNAGIRLNANGGSYEITPENLYVGQISATTTAASKVLLVTEGTN